ncbi:MAG: hypothetical protein ACRD3W_18010, partial [Terriglobales bacterium]
FMRRTELQEKLGQHNKVIAELTMFLNTFPRNSSALYCRQQAYRIKHDYEHAQQDLEELIEINPDIEEWYTARAALYKDMGRNADAQKDLLTAKQIKETGARE